MARFISIAPRYINLDLVTHTEQAGDAVVVFFSSGQQVVLEGEAAQLFLGRMASLGVATRRD